VRSGQVWQPLLVEPALDSAGGRCNVPVESRLGAQEEFEPAPRDAVQERAEKALAKLDSAAPRVPCNRLLGVIVHSLM